MPVDPQLQSMLDAMQAAGWPKLGSVPVTELRAMTKMPLTVVTEVQSVSDGTIPGPAGDIPVRVYRPADEVPGVIVYFHGGGWVVGDLDSVDPTLRLVANNTGCTVVSVDYRLAPEHPFPAAVDDAMAAASWVARHLGDFALAPVPLMVMGDSAGGNLAAVVSLLARDAGGPDIALQILIYPATEGNIHSKAMYAFEPPFLTRQDMEWFFDQYLPPQERSDPRLAPAEAASHAGLPPAVIVTAEYDLLTAHGENYARLLEEAGVPVTRLHFEGAIHGFFVFGAQFDIGQRAIDDVSRAIVRHVTRSD